MMVVHSSQRTSLQILQLNFVIFKHNFSSPHYPRANGFAERNVQTAKNLLRKCHLDGSDVYKALLMLRNTDRSETLKSPAQRLYSRKTRTTIPTTKEQLKPNIVENVPDELTKTRIKQKQYADRCSKQRPQLQIGDEVVMKTGHRVWEPAIVTNSTEYPRSVIVKKGDSEYRRNQSHLKKTKAKFNDENIGVDDNATHGYTDSNETIPIGHDSSLITPSEPSSTQVASSAPIQTRSGRISKPVDRFDPAKY